MYPQLGQYAPFTGMLEDATGLVATGNYPTFDFADEIFPFFHDAKGLFVSMTATWAELTDFATITKGGTVVSVTRRAYRPHFDPFNSGNTGFKDFLNSRYFRIGSSNSAFCADFTKLLYRRNSSAGAGLRPFFWPFMNIAAVTVDGGTITGSNPASFDDFTTGIPIQDLNGNIYVSLTPGETSGTLDVSSVSLFGSGHITERYSQISATPDIINIGQVLKLQIPPNMESSGRPFISSTRDGFRFVRQISFVGKNGPIDIPVTTAMITSTLDVPDTITVTVPNDAITGPVSFISKPQNGDVTDDLRTETQMMQDDYFSTHFDLIIR